MYKIALDTRKFGERCTTLDIKGRRSALYVVLAAKTVTEFKEQKL